MDLDRALDGDAMARLLGARSCTPRYVRFQPGRRLLVLYDLDGELAHLTIFKPQRTERLWARVRGSRLAQRMPELGGVLQRFPLDVRLPGLAVAALDGDLVRYKPGRRAVFRFAGAYGKLRADEAGAAHVTVARELIAHGIHTPAPLEYRPELGMALYEEVRGTRLATLRGGGLEGWMEPVAATLAQLHATPAAALRAHSMAAELADLYAAAETATALGAPALDLAAALADRLTEIAPLPAVTIHGSFHDDQVLVASGDGSRRDHAGALGDDRVTLVDLDSAARGDPRLDVGHFAAYLTAAGEDAARERFLAACDAGPEVLVFEAAALLRWSSLPFRDLERGWRAAVAHRVELARQRLASSVITAS
ncbi:MAG TPA: phosphotransferase [Solirubrobacteraceae bacterium]|nr:phosphotransferase [Solirubrobacteraceae bacterium]